MAISPTTVGSSTPYQITSSKAVIADLRLDLTTTNPSEFEVKWPTGTTGVAVVLSGGPGSITQDLTAMASPSSVTFGNRTISVQKASAGGTETLTCQVTGTGGLAIDTWRVRMSAMSAPAAPGWRFQQAENDPSALTITRLMCDPAAGFSVSPMTPPDNVREKTGITFTGVDPKPAGTVVGSPQPDVYANWDFTGGNIAISAFPSCSLALGVPSFSPTMPGVYADTDIQVTEQVWFDSPCPAVGFLNSSSTQTLTIQPRPQRAMLVLDRSGSMLADNRWTNAVAAARVLVHLMVALRPGINAGDRLGLMVFEDTQCIWHALPIDPLISDPVPLGTLAAADGVIANPVLLGNPGSCTPIGDALVKAMDELGALGVADEPHFTIILMTDGMENSGTGRVGPTPPSVQSFEVARASRGAVNSRLALFAIGLGTYVQDDVLDALPLPAGLPSTTNPPIYRKVTKVAELVDAIGQMMSFSLEARQKPALPGGPTPADPTPLGAARYFELESKVRVVAVAILWTLDPTDTIVLSRRNLPTTATTAFTNTGALVKKTPTHGFVSVDLGPNAPGTQWRVEHQRGGVLQDISDDRILIFKDLFAKADVVFDRRSYGTGMPMTITARLRAGHEGVSGATISVELARPGESLGTFLVQNSAGYRPQPPHKADPSLGKGAMLEDVLQRRDMQGLTLLEPHSIFVDGTDQLWEDTNHPDGPGNYVNTYDGLDQEGTYTFRFYVQAILPDGSPFDQVMTISRWVGVDVDSIITPFTVNMNLTAPAGMKAALVSVQPIDAAGQYLGPFWDHVVDFRTNTGTLQPVPDRYDGTYARILLYRRGAVPIVTVTVQDKPLPPIVVASGCLGLLLRPFLWLWRKILGLAARRKEKVKAQPAAVSEPVRDDDRDR